MMNIIKEPNISFRVQAVINKVYLSCSLDSSLQCGPVLLSGAKSGHYPGMTVSA